MSTLPGRLARTLLAGSLAGLVGIAGLVANPAPARADSAPADPALPSTPATVTADGLPTVQINGVVWAQVVVGNTVYAAGDFTRARPAGAAPGTNEVVRNHMLAYDIRTGELISSFAPDLDAQALALAASPDGSRVYVGGEFEVANGQPRYSIAAYSTATGQLLSDFKPVVGAAVRAIAVSPTAVYIGGDTFGVAGGAGRNFLAALDPATGAALPWRPVVDQKVNALALVNNNTAVVVGGNFRSLNGQSVYSIGEVDATTGASKPFAASWATTNGGVDSAILALSTDADTVYATGFSWQNSGNFEGILAIDPQGGAVKWNDACRGDTYSVYATGTAEYGAGHAHICENIGGFPQNNPVALMSDGHPALAFSKAATGSVGLQTGLFVGQPAPNLLDWFPTVEPGSFTGQYQAAWSVAGNDKYIVYGGEFPRVNDKGQQGLVRFAVPSIAPNKVGPDGTVGLTPTLSSPATGTVRVSWQTTSDQDNATLTYDVYRSDKPGTPVYSTTATSTWWNLPTLSFLDRTAPPGASVSYTVTARDPFGNAVTGAARSVTVATGGTLSLDDYAMVVVADGPTSYWRMNKPNGSSTLRDTAGTFDAVQAGGVTLGRAGALTGRQDTAAAFNGASSGSAATQATVVAPDVLSMEAWFSTTSGSGGQLLGFGDKTQGSLSYAHDRFLAIDGAGRVSLNVFPMRNVTVRSAAGFNDGRWHHVVGTLSRAGTALYLDGKLVGTSDGLAGQNLTGYWRIGGDTVWDGSSPWLSGSLDEVAVYSRALTPAQVARHYSVGTSRPGNLAPTAAFTSTTANLTLSVDGSGSTDLDGTIASYVWDFGDGQTGTGKTASHTYAAAGSYPVKLTVTDNAGATGSTTTSVTATAPPAAGTVLARDTFERQVTSGWGTADTGGAWTIVGGAANASVTGGYGRLAAAPGTGAGASLPFSARDVSVSADITLENTATGNGTYYSLGARATGSNRYNAQLDYSPGGGVGLGLVAVVNGAETQLGYHALPGTYAAGTVLKLRFETVGSPTALRARVWPSTAAEPADWQVSATDSTAAMQAAGGIYADLYTSKSATTPGAVRLDNLAVAVPGGTPPPPANVTPTAAFTATPTGLTVAVDGSASADPDGSIASYAWDFGDGQTATGRTASHSYAAAGSYTVKLTVTDNAGATASASKAVTVSTPPPGSALAQDAFGRSVTGGWGTADVGGPWTVLGTAANASVGNGTGGLTAANAVSIAADLGVSVQDVAVQADVALTQAASGGGAFVNLAGRNAAGGQYNAQLWFASDGTVLLSILKVVNGAETDLGDYQLAGTYTAGSPITVRLDLAGTAQKAKAWPAGTAEPAGWQLSTADSTAALQRAGGLEVSLYNARTSTGARTVRVDNVWAGAAGTAPGSTPPPPGNKAPTGSFTASVSGASVSVDASASSDPDGTIASYAWDFGDGATGTGKTASHTYAAAGSYSVKLTVTDNAGATASASKAVTVSPPPGSALAQDAFGRTVTGGWGSADVGGAWTTAGPAAGASVTGGVGSLTAAKGTGLAESLGISAQDVAVQADVTLTAAPSGGGSYVNLAGRDVAGSQYNAQLAFASDGTVYLSILKVVGGVETDLGGFQLAGKYTVGSTLTVRLDLSGTTQQAKAWPAATAEPAGWQVTTADSTAGLQRAGGLQVQLYTSASATAAQTLRVDNVWAGPAGTKP